MYIHRMKKKTARRPFNEVFKNKIKRFFEKFATVKTEVEILGLPRKMDLLVVESDTPIKEHVSLFQYFKKFNIIEFKSEVDELNLSGYLKMGYYLHAFLLRENGALPENTTLTLVSTLKPKIPVERISWLEVRKGLYWVKGIGILDLYVVVIDELSKNNLEEYHWLKIFVSRTKRKELIIQVFAEDIDEEKEELLLLYREEVVEILKELGEDMNALKREAYKIAREFGIEKEIREEYKELIQLEKYKTEKAEVEKQKAEVEKQKAQKEAERKTHKEKLRTAIAMKEQSLDIALIEKITKLDKVFLDRLFRRIRSSVKNTDFNGYNLLPPHFS
jgi:hypothetical protein